LPKDREEIIDRAVDVWVPLDDLLDACFPARWLTIDVEQRLYALRNEYGGYSRGLNEAIKEASFAAYAEEKARHRICRDTWMAGRMDLGRRGTPPAATGRGTASFQC
jgi:hypothetical protein